MAGGYWTSGGPADTGGVPPGPETGPSPFIRHNRHDWRRNSRSHDRMRTTEKSDDDEDTTPVLGETIHCVQCNPNLTLLSSGCLTFNNKYIWWQAGYFIHEFPLQEIFLNLVFHFPLEKI